MSEEKKKTHADLFLRFTPAPDLASLVTSALKYLTIGTKLSQMTVRDHHVLKLGYTAYADHHTVTRYSSFHYSYLSFILVFLLLCI